MADAVVANMQACEDELEATHDAFLIYPGMGPMLYLTADGRVLEDGRAWDGAAVVELTGCQATQALAVGALNTGIPALLDLLPPAPEGAGTCPTCGGTHYYRPHPQHGPFPCFDCGALGWIPVPDPAPGDPTA